LVLFVAGIARDLVWHATHNTQREFETASKQVEVHWLLWLGVLVIVTTIGLTLARSEQTGLRRGYLIALVSGLLYVGVSVWHFVEHANGNDPQLAHLFLYAGAAGILTGGIAMLFDARRRNLD
jgi:hypothetical protein